MKKTRGIFICFMGVDGCGKSTLARKSMGILSDYGISSRYVWGGYTLYALKPFVDLVRKSITKKTDPYKDYEGYHDSLRRIGKRRTLFWFYQRFLLIEYLVQILVKVKIPLLFGKNIICDRYVFDTITSISSNYAFPIDKQIRLVDNMLSICPKPQIVYLVDVPERIAISRKDDIPSIEYLKHRRRYYQNIFQQCSERYNVKIIDGSEDLDDLTQYLATDISELVFKGPGVVPHE